MKRAAPQLTLNFIVLKRSFTYATQRFESPFRSHSFLPSTSFASPGGAHV